jgi:two-component system, sensor histidine kinase
MVDAPSTVLVVDDEDASRFTKVQTLRRAGFDVHEASTGQAALSAADRVKPDILVLDVNLPDINGIEIARRLRAAPDSGGLAILQVSHTAITPADRVRGLEQGADVYLTEPIDGTVLVATVRALIRARRAEAALAGALEGEKHARGLAEQANRLKDDFIATLSHELRTPLNALMGWIYQLRHSQLDDRARERALDSLERNARLQAQLIDDLMDISRISKGKLRLRLHVVDLRAVAAEAIETVRGSAIKKRLTITIDSKDRAPVLGDRARLQQVVTNLLNNAVQHTPEDGAIRVRVTAARPWVMLDVADTGSGIDADFLPHVFDPFRQGAGPPRRQGGLGLGLSVVRQLVELHGGSASVASRGPGLGSTFTVTLPLEEDAPMRPEATTVELDGTSDPVLAHTAAIVSHPSAGEIAAILEASGGHAVAVGSPAEFDQAVADQSFDVAIVGRDDDHRGSLPRVVVHELASPAQLVRDVLRALPADRRR